MQSDSLPGVFWTYDSLSACADEVGMSRIYGGIHFSFNNTEGKRTGGKIDDYVVANFLLSNDSRTGLSGPRRKYDDIPGGPFRRMDHYARIGFTTSP